MFLGPKEHKGFVSFLSLVFVFTFLELLCFLFLLGRALAFSSLDCHSCCQSCAKTNALIMIEGRCGTVKRLIIIFFGWIFSLLFFNRILFFGKEAIQLFIGTSAFSTLRLWLLPYFLKTFWYFLLLLHMQIRLLVYLLLEVTVHDLFEVIQLILFLLFPWNKS